MFQRFEHQYVEKLLSQYMDISLHLKKIKSFHIRTFILLV